MRRITVLPRPNWQARCTEDGFVFASIDGEEYWQESACYSFTSDEVEAIHDATSELNSMCFDLIQDVVKSGDYSDYHLPEWVLPLIDRSWQNRDPHVYGRFDLVFKDGDIKLLEYNADTPTSLLESSVVQWTWLTDRELPDQFNSIHEKLVERWRQIANKENHKMSRVYLTTMGEAGLEDWGNLNYMAEVVFQAGIDCSTINLEDVGWDQAACHFVDTQDKQIQHCFKLYPWEWLIGDEFGKHTQYSKTRFIEPAWKMLLSNKAILPLLWARHEGHPLLLPAFFAGNDAIRTKASSRWAKKPILSREGANITMIDNGVPRQLTGSTYSCACEDVYVLQEWRDLPDFNGWHPVIGSWVVGDEPAGIGIREDRGQVTGNLSCFTPHYFEE